MTFTASIHSYLISIESCQTFGVKDDQGSNAGSVHVLVF